MNPQPKPVRAPKERKPLRRKRRMRAKVSRRVRDQSDADKRYLEAVRLLPCCAPRVSLIGRDALEHIGEIHAHHAGKRPGVGMKAADDTAIALCRQHHWDWHSAVGVFWGWTKRDRRRWADTAISDTRRIIAEDRDGQLIGEERLG